MIRQLPQQEKRVETGPVQFGDDWPGVFIRGDNAFGYMLSLKSLLEGVKNCERNYLAEAQLEDLATLLRECIVGASAHVPAALPRQTK